MKRVIAFACILAVLLLLAACPQPVPSATGHAGTTGSMPGSGASASSATEPFGPSATHTGSPTIPGTVPTIPQSPTTAPVASATTPAIPTTAPNIPTTAPTISTTAPTAPTVPPTPPSVPPTQPIVPPVPPDVGVELPVLDDQWEIIDCDFVNLRKYPDTDAQSLGRITVGNRVKLLNWYGKFGKVRYNGKTGYILASYLAPAHSGYMEAALNVVPVTDVYTYGQLIQDLITFDCLYPERVELEVIGYSARGEQIPVIRVGNADAPRHVLLHGGIHGREHMTSWLLMALLDYWLDVPAQALADVCFHVIPMVNPDGVTIAQTGHLPQDLLPIYYSDLKNGYTDLELQEYARNWKANGQGVDLNRNFPAGWEMITERTGPSSEMYRGAEPFSEPETQMLRDYTLRYCFDATISYHARGSIIYYEYGNHAAVNSQSADLANAIYDFSGYYLVDSEGVDGAGYKDWAIAEQKLPSLTIEIGCQGLPLVKRELYSIFVRNLDVLPTVAQWVKT